MEPNQESQPTPQKKLPSWLITVTPFSKYLAMFLFILLPFIGFYLGMQYQQKVTVTTPVVSEVQKNVIPTSKPIPTSTTNPLASPLPTSGSTVNWKTYTNKDYGFSFKYPQEYTVTEKIQKAIFNDFYNQSIDSYELTFSTGKLVDQGDGSKLADWSGFSIDVGPTGGRTISQYYAGQKGMGGPIIATSVNPDGNAIEAATLSNVNGTYRVYRFGNYFYSVGPFQNGNTLPDSSDQIWEQIDLILSTIKFTQ